MGLSVNMVKLLNGSGEVFPSIYIDMGKNGSPAPVFDSDEASTYMLVTLAANNEVANQDKQLLFNDLDHILAYANGAANQAANGAERPAVEIISNSIHDRVSEILEILKPKKSRSNLFPEMALNNQSYSRSKYLDPLISIGWVSMEYPQERDTPQLTISINRCRQAYH